MILENPFHRLGLLADVDAKGFTKRTGRAKALLAAEMPLEFEPDLHFLGCMRNSKTIEVAERELQTALGKVQHGMFWFTASGVVDDMAVDHLRAGQFEQALSIWRKSCSRPEISDNYISCLNNLGSLELVMAIANPLRNLSLRERQLHFLEGLENKILLFTKPSTEVQKEFFASIGDDILSRQSDKIRNLFKESIPALLETANQHGLRLAIPDWAAKIAGHGEFAAELLAPFQSDIRAQIERLIAEAEKEIDKGGMAAFNASKKLELESAQPLEDYRKVAAQDDLFADGLADKVAETMLNGGVKYFNGLDEVKLEDVTRVLLLTEAANNIARGVQLKERLRENLETLRNREKNEREVGQYRKESAAVHDALGAAISAPTQGSSRRVVAELTPGVSHRWGVIDAIVALEERGVEAHGPSFRHSATFIEAADAVANVLLSKVIAEVNEVQDNLDRNNLELVGDCLMDAERACMLLLAKFNTKYKFAGGVQVFEVELKTRNRILENHETIKNIVGAVSHARKSEDRSWLWWLGGILLFYCLTQC